jgi:uncharacterized membrane protein YbaN (DUF454 family)
VNSVKKAALMLAGCISVAFGTIGIALPLVPTTPFFIAAAICFTSSSPRAKNWLERNRFFGEYIENYTAGKGVSRSKKAYGVVFLWMMLALSGYLMRDNTVVLLILLAVGLAVTAHILMLKNRPKEDPA